MFLEDPRLFPEYNKRRYFLFKRKFIYGDYYIVPNDINDALCKCLYRHVGPEILNPLTQLLNHCFTNANEMITFLSHVFIETEGLTVFEDPLAYTDPDRARDYYKGLIGNPTESYHGRGLLMIAYPENYLDISRVNGLGRLYLDNPSVICSNIETCVSTSFEAWRKYIKTSKKYNQNNHTGSTREIFKRFKGKEPTEEDMYVRYQTYYRIATLWNVKDLIVEKFYDEKHPGCMKIIGKLCYTIYRFVKNIVFLDPGDPLK